MRGIKGHAEIGGFARWGIKVLEMSAEIGRRADLPLYVHFGTLWGLPESGANGEDADTILERVIPKLRPGDILAHPFTRHPGGFVNREGKVHSVIRAAIDQGLKIDVGHGSHFSYRLARVALAAGIVPHTLGADMHGYNTEVPPPAGTPAQHYDDENHPFRGQARFSLTQAMSSMIALGIPLEDVVPMVTTNPAQMLGLSRPARRAQARLPRGRVGAVGRSRPLHPARQRGHEGGRRAAAAAGLLPARRQALRRRLADPAAGRRGLETHGSCPRPGSIAVDNLPADPRDDWAALDQAARDAAYNNNAAVADSAKWIELRNSASADYRAGSPAVPQSRLCARPSGRRSISIRRPIRARRVSSSFMAATGSAIHASCLLASRKGPRRPVGRWPFPVTRLLRKQTCRGIVAEIGQALDWLVDNGARYGIAGPLVIAGWSAGAPARRIAPCASGRRRRARNIRHLRSCAAARHQSQRQR